jgi:hypothetical protein
MAKKHKFSLWKDHCLVLRVPDSNRQRLSNLCGACFHPLFVSNSALRHGIGSVLFRRATGLDGDGNSKHFPLSEYAYMRQGGRNPTIARESVRHQRRKPEKKDFGVLLGVAGLTSFFKISPWDLFFFQAEPILGLSIVAFLMIALLALLALIYKRKFRKYIKFDA